MPVTRCPHCGQRMLVTDSIIGQLVGCSRCERTFESRVQSPVSRFGELLLVLAAVAVGVVVTWLIMKNR